MRLLLMLLIIFSLNLFAGRQLVHKLSIINTQFEIEKISLLQCLDSNNCYAVSDVGKLSGDEDLVHCYINIYISTDQGNTWNLDWETYYVPGKDSVWTFGKAFILDSNHFYFTFLERMILDMTSDGGKTFKRITFGEFSLDEKYYSIRKISMYNEHIGVIIFNHGILSTNDGWKTYDFYAYQGSRKSSDVLFFLDSNNVLIQSGLHINSFDIFNIPNQTRTKYSEPIESPTGEEEKLLYNIEIVTDSLFYGTGGQKYGANEAGKDIIYKSTDRGENWEIIYEHIKENTFSCTQIAFRNEHHGIAAGGWGKFMETFDGGYTWNYYEVPEEVENSVYSRVAFAGKYPLLAASNGGIYRLEKVTSVAEPLGSGISIVPNPAWEYIEILISSDSKGACPLVSSGEIEIYNVLGGKVLSESIHPMTSRHRMNVANLPRGVYFVRIGDRVEKFIKM